MERDQVSDEDQTMHQVQASDEDHSLKQQAMSVVQTKRSIVEKDPYRQTHHVMPPVGLLNDPNGVIQWQGVYHLFYQWMPFKTGHGAKFWGHYTSTDLLTWKPEPIALAPSSWYDKSGCYSGSAVVHNDVMYLFYTGNVKDTDGNRRTYQCMATSTDGIHFEKQGVIAHLPPGYTPHFRDPKVWRHDDRWLMVVGAQSTQLQGQVVLFQSFDLYEWTFIGPLAGSGIPPLADFGYMWECPDLFTLDGDDILICSPQGLEQDGMKYRNRYQAGYFMGELKYQGLQGSIEKERSEKTAHSPGYARFRHGDFVELDRGFDFYAPQTMTDELGRRIMFAWMAVPEQDEQHHPTIEHEWIHCLTIPRVLHTEKGRVYQQPVPELKKLRKEMIVSGDIEERVEETNMDHLQQTAHATEIVWTHVHTEQMLTFTIKDHASFTYDPLTGTCILARQSFDEKRREQRACKISSLHKLHIFVDASSVEVFINDGEEVFSARIFPDPQNTSLRLRSAGIVKGSIEVWRLTDRAFK